MFDTLNFVYEKLKNEITNISIEKAYPVDEIKSNCIIITEMDNYENANYTTIDTIENVSELAVQIDIFTTQSIDGKSADNVVIEYRTLVDDIMQKTCGMQRTFSTIINRASKPNIKIARCIMRYIGLIDLDTGYIYKKG